MNPKKTNALFFSLLALFLALSLIPLTACNPGSVSAAEPSPTAEIPAQETDCAGSTYLNDTYRISFQYPVEMILSEYALGDGVEGYAPSQAVELVNNGYRLVVHIKVFWDATTMGGCLGAGQVVSEDIPATLLGRALQRNRLVEAGHTRLVWYGGRFEDLDLYLRLEDASGHKWEDVDIPSSLVAEVEGMFASFTRTGEPLTPPDDIVMEPVPQPAAVPVAGSCDLPSRLGINTWAQVLPGLPNVIRIRPGIGEKSGILGGIPAGNAVRVLEGPVCADGSYWWRVDAGLVSGWTPEGGSDVYWLAPLADGSSIEVNGWVGVIMGTPALPQVDDYFQLLDQGGSRYGITALDPVLRQQLEAYRDTGTMIRIWGALYYERMDAYDTQIEVSRFAEYASGSDGSTSQVDGWVGVIVANPPGSQFDDYFQMLDQEGTRYGIDSLDEDLHQQLAALRSTGRMIRIWGTLSRDVPDAYGSQIQVSRLEIMP